jgi:biotin transporter BioY
VIPYIPGDIVKLIIAMAIGMQLRKQLLRANLV